MRWMSHDVVSVTTRTRKTTRICERRSVQCAPDRQCRHRSRTSKARDIRGKNLSLRPSVPHFVAQEPATQTTREGGRKPYTIDLGCLYTKTTENAHRLSSCVTPQNKFRNFRVRTHADKWNLTYTCIYINCWFSRTTSRLLVL